MTCNLSQTELRFPGHSLKIRPFTLNYHIQAGRSDYSLTEISIEAGEHIHDLGKGYHPIEIWIGDDRLARLCFNQNDLSRGRERAQLRLRDPRAVLEQGIVSINLPKTTLEKAVEQVWKSVDDPHGVLVGYSFTDEDSGNDETKRRLTAYGHVKKAIEFAIDQNPLNPLGVRTEVGKRTRNDLIDYVTEKVWGTTPGEVVKSWEMMKGLHESTGGVRFEEVSPAEAFTQLSEQFNVTTYVDDGGMLWIGDPTTYTLSFSAGTDLEDLIVNEVGVYGGFSDIRGVILEGKYDDSLRGGLSTYYDDGVGRIAPFRGRVEVTNKNNTDGRIVRLKSVKAESLEDLKRQAIMALRERTFEEQSGSIEVLPLSGETDSAIALDIGDHIWLLPQVDDCEHRDTAGGLFGVRGLVHRINSRDGWRLSVMLGRLLPSKDLEVKAFVSNIETNNEWVDAELYYAETFGENGIGMTR